MIRSRAAFTLIELLLSMAVLAILAVLILHIINAASGTIRFSNRSIDAAAQARLAFDRIGADLAGRVADDQTDFVAGNTGPNFLQFLSEVTSAGAASNRGASLVTYQLAAHPDNGDRVGLLRSGKAVDWATRRMRGLDASGLPVTFGGASFPSSLLPSGAADFDLLSGAIVRAVVGFQLYPDNLPVELQDGTQIPNARGQIVYSLPIRVVVSSDGTKTARVANLRRVAAMVVGLVAIDLESVKQLDVSQSKALSDAFSGVPAMNQMPVSKWMADTQDMTGLPAVIPLPVRQAVRVYQRTFLLNPFPGQNS